MPWPVHGRERTHLFLELSNSGSLPGKAGGLPKRITLLELGLFARSGKLRVCCPEPFWRKGNVDVVCARYGVPLLPSLKGLIDEVGRLR